MSVRAPLDTDAPVVAELLNDIGRALYGEPSLEEAEVRRWWTMPGIEALVAEEGGRAVGYGDLNVEDESGIAFLDVRVLPGERAAANALVAELEGRATALRRDPIRVVAPERAVDVVAAAGARGYEPVRHSYEMLIELGEPAPAVFPEGISVRTVRAGEEPRVHAASEEAFADHWEFRPTPYERWRRWFVETERFDPTLWWIAEDGDEPAAICLCNLHESGDPHYGWVASLGVRPRWRRRGLGEALLRHAFAEFHRRGCTRAGLGVDAENTSGAVRLYERVGMHVARREDVYEKRAA